MICYDFHSKISNEKEDMMCCHKIGPGFKNINYTLDFYKIEQVLKQPIEFVCVLVVNLIIPHDIIKQHLLVQPFSIQKWER